MQRLVALTQGLLLGRAGRLWERVQLGGGLASRLLGSLELGLGAYRAGPQRAEMIGGEGIP